GSGQGSAESEKAKEAVVLAFDFHGKTAIVTGAAHGIGRAISVELGRAGARVFACDILPDDLVETQRQVAAAGGFCEYAVVDVTDEAQVNQFVTRVATAEGVQILVNCAGGVGGQTGKPIEEVSAAEWDGLLKVNLYGAFHMTRAVVPFMKKQRYGRIINISSGAGRTVSLTGIQAYASAKAGQIGFSRQTAHELGPWNITVNNIAPGFIRSNPSTERQWESYGPEGQKALVASIPLKRLGDPEDIAYGVLYFASDYAKWVTGQTISIDGGRTMI
ncbi:MAG: SDR family NAD(P)-dependent oxidoreductase, partial [Mycobacterium leprae]